MLERKGMLGPLGVNVMNGSMSGGSDAAMSVMLPLAPEQKVFIVF